MRWISMLTAMLVTLSLYLLLMERESVMAFAGAQPAAEPDTAAKVDTLRRVSVVAQRSVARPFAAHVLVRGQTEAAREVDVRAETGGRVISEPLRKGATVAEGSVLCELDPGTREASLAQAEAALAEAKARLPEAGAGVTRAEAQLTEAEINDRAARRLSEEGFASETRVAATASAVSTAKAALVSAQAGLEAAQTAIRTAEASVAAARKDIERLTIRAPFAGVLDSDAAELGALMQPSSLCATVIQLDPIHLVGYVPETELGKIQPGALATGRLASGHTVQGVVSFIGRMADTDTRTFRVEVEIDNSDGMIRAGQTAEILIAAPAQNAHLLPQSALTLDDAGRLGVRLAADGDVARFAPVEVLNDTLEGIWVQGLPQDANVIVVGQEFVSDGVPIRVTQREGRQ
ncbi:putative Co/Zn/Cd efflux system membrane fusion protein [Rhodovulum sp. P5]|uniref:efflux RND transporter periplasmic adaptor subunit n=1 Tax=Rhodovulum sp. P5 TaxID=1564506 RepID=UPI0009C1B64C|nr:efflux RND transporter periplasmic adaptor subunit [Rhodovulum sp. P5]ARE38509.1 putative Co/Zn/Cd efflux system membrane fusion protein [Rhodovulum sp. P5]